MHPNKAERRIYRWTGEGKAYQRNGHIRKQAHAKARQGRNGGCGSDQVAVNLLHTEHIRRVGIADSIGRVGIVAHTRSARLREDVGVDTDDVGHGEEGGEARSDFGEEVGPLAFFGLYAHSSCQ